MGVYTTIIDEAGRGIQIKTGNDCCQHFWHDEEIPKKDGVWDGCLDSYHYDRSTNGTSYLTTRERGRCFVVIKNRRVVEVVDEVDNTSEAIAGFMLEQQARRQIEPGSSMPLDEFVQLYGELPSIDNFHMADYLAEKHGVESRW